MHKHLDNIQINGQGGEDVLFGWDGHLVVATQHQLGVVHKEEWEHQGAHRWINQVNDSSAVVHGDETEQRQNDETNEQQTAAGRKIPFRLECENGQRQADDGADGHRQKNFLHLCQKLIFKIRFAS